jgi:hypothetical protein
MKTAMSSKFLPDPGLGAFGLMPLAEKLPAPVVRQP